MAQKKNTAQYSEEWDYTHPSGVRAHVARYARKSTFAVTFSRTDGLKLTNGDYELKTDSSFIPHSIVDSIIADDIAAAQRAAKH